MRKEELEFIIKLLYKRSGLALTPDKEYLLESRLTPIAHANGCADVANLAAVLKSRPTEALLTEITEAMTTNETSFFRDGKPFEHLRQSILPQLHQGAIARRSLRIWSAACSNGQEPYTIAMTLLEDAAKYPGWKYDIVATDICSKVLAKAKQGIYSQFEAQRGMPIQLLLKYFKSNTDTTWQVKDELRNMINFRPQNLVEDFSGLGQFDLIFCRNVLIYFDEQAKAATIDRLCNNLQPTGYLFLGSTESIKSDNKRLIQPEGMRGIYQNSVKALQYA
jgi:chemotaxis protein methyltransferase CheR